MSDLADKIRELKATKQFSDVDLHQMAEVMSYAKPEENYQRLKVLLLAGQPLVSREVVLGLVAAEPPLCERYFLQGLLGPDMGKFVCESCGTVLGDLPIDEIDAAFEDHRNELHEKLVRLLGAAAERQMKRGSE